MLDEHRFALIIGSIINKKQVLSNYRQLEVRERRNNARTSK